MDAAAKAASQAQDAAKKAVSTAQTNVAQVMATAKSAVKDTTNSISEQAASMQAWAHTCSFLLPPTTMLRTS